MNRLLTIVRIVVIFTLASTVHGETVPEIISTRQCAMECGVIADTVVVANVQYRINEMLTALDGAVSLRAEYAARCSQLIGKQHEMVVLQERIRNEPDNLQLRRDVLLMSDVIVQLIGCINCSRSQMLDIMLAVLPECERIKFRIVLEQHGLDVPEEMKVRHRSELDWRLIKRYVIQERRCQKNGDECDDEVQKVLAGVRNDPLVLEAKARLDAYLMAAAEEFSEWPT